jgi:hypothetical protein
VGVALPYGQMLRSAALGIVACGDLAAAHDKQFSYLLEKGLPIRPPPFIVRH